MAVSIKDLHTYLNLVTEGKADPLVLKGAEGYSLETGLIPNEADGTLAVYDSLTDSVIFPGQEVQRKIRETLDRL